MSPNYYDLLGVCRFSTLLQLKAAYDNKLIELTQNNKQDSQEAEQIKAAYTVLSDRAQRWQYDTEIFRTPKSKLAITSLDPLQTCGSVPSSRAEKGTHHDELSISNFNKKDDYSDPILKQNTLKEKERQQVLQESFPSNLEEYIRASKKHVHEQNTLQAQTSEPFIINSGIPCSRTKRSPSLQSVPERAQSSHENYSQKGKRNIKRGRLKSCFIVIAMLVGVYIWSTRGPNLLQQPSPTVVSTPSGATSPVVQTSSNGVSQDVAPAGTLASLDLPELISENTVRTTSETPVRVQVTEFSLKDPIITQIMHQLYGADKYWSTYRCWQTELVTNNQTSQYCMKPLAASLVTADGNEKLYLQITGCWTNGSSVSEDGTMCGPHPEPGAFGGVVWDFQTSQIISSSKQLSFPGSWGEGPHEPLILVRLSSAGDLGWLGEGKYMNRGEIYYFPALFVSRGKTVLNTIGNVPGSWVDDSGNITQHTTEIRYSYTFDTSVDKEGYYPMRVKRVTLEDEKVSSRQAFRAYFDPNTLSYQCASKFCIQDRN